MRGLCLVSGVAAIILVQGCSASETGDVSMTQLASQRGVFSGFLEFSSGAPAVGHNRLELVVRDSSAAVEGATITVEPWMPAHGHGSHVVPSVNETGAGHYEVEDLVFTMPGTWELRIDVATRTADDRLLAQVQVR